MQLFLNFEDVVQQMVLSFVFCHLINNKDNFFFFNSYKTLLFLFFCCNKYIDKFYYISIFSATIKCRSNSSNCSIALKQRLLIGISLHPCGIVCLNVVITIWIQIWQTIFLSPIVHWKKWIPSIKHNSNLIII